MKRLFGPLLAALLAACTAAEPTPQTATTVPVAAPPTAAATPSAAASPTRPPVAATATPTTATTPTPRPEATATPRPPATATPVVGVAEAELAKALANPPPTRDVVDLWRRYKGKGAAVPTVGPIREGQVGDLETFWKIGRASCRERGGIAVVGGGGRE